MKLHKPPRLGTHLVPILALGLAMTTALPPAIASQTVPSTTHYEGTVGRYNGSCTNAVCNTAGGCRFNGNIYDYWYAGKTCSGSLITTDAGGTCSESMKLCREVTNHTDRVNCTGVITSVEAWNKTMCAGGANTRPVDPPVNPPTAD